MLDDRCYLIVVVGVSVGLCFVKQKTAYEMRISDWSSDVCSSDLLASGYKADVSASLGRTTGQLIGLRNKFQQAAEMKQNITSTASRMEMMAAQIVQTDELGSEFLALALPNADHPTP